MGPCGGGGGGARDVDTRGVDRVAKVVVRHGDTVVHAVSVLYDRGGRQEWTDLWGGPGGALAEVLHTYVPLCMLPPVGRGAEHDAPPPGRRPPIPRRSRSRESSYLRVPSSQICLGPDEHFTSVEGHCGEFEGSFVVRSLTFVSNRRAYGPYGRSDDVVGAVPFALPAAGGRIVGFHARSGRHLDAIGTYVKVERTDDGNHRSTYV
jgi:hypothetical protein